MRFFEIITEQPVAAMTAPKKVSTDSPVVATKAQNPIDTKSAPAKKGRINSNNFYFNAEGDRLPPENADAASYTTASNSELNSIVSQIDAKVKEINPGAKAERKSDTMPPHIRVLYVPYDEIKSDIEQIIGSSLVPAQDAGIKTMLAGLSGSPTFVRNYAEINGIIYPFIFNQAGATNSGDSGPVLVSDKQLTPDKLFQGGAEFASADALAEATKQKLAGIKDQMLKSALIQLVDVANGKLKAVQPDYIAYISKNVKTFNNISKDFGEILTPIVIARQKGQAISFPKASNEALIDVHVGGNPIAVKSLSGSGNGMTGIMDMIDNYQDAISGETDEKRKKLYKILQGQRIVKGRTSLDNMIETAFSIPTKEAEEIQKLIGGPFKNYAAFEAAVSNWVKQFDQQPDIVKKYTAYLETIKPISVISGYGPKLKSGQTKIEPIGMPSDSTKYISYKDLGANDKAFKEARSGLPTFKQNFAKAASLQLVYMLAISTEQLIKFGGPDGEAMTNLLTDIMRNKGAYAAHITINRDGTITIIEKPFSKLRFGYKYHAATDAPNRNAPGWHIIFK